MKKTIRQMSNNNAIECLRILTAIREQVLDRGICDKPVNDIVFSTIIGKNITSLKSHQTDFDFERQLIIVRYGVIADNGKEQSWVVDKTDPDQYSAYMKALKAIYNVEFPVEFYTITVEEARAFGLSNTVISTLWFIIDDESVESNMPILHIDTEPVEEV